MKVLHIVAGELSKGAARGAAWLHQGLLANNCESRVLSMYPSSEYDNVSSIVGAGTIGSMMRKAHLLVDVAPSMLYPKRVGLFGSAMWGFDIFKHEWYQWADIIHLHWVNLGMLSLRQISKIDKPVVWTLRDMWGFTGGCHYSLECEKYSSGCGACPRLGSSWQWDLSSINYKRKEKYLSGNIQPVAISNWLADCVNQSKIMSTKEVETIHNCVDMDLFSRVDNISARQELGWEQNDKVVLCGAFGLGSKWKGFAKFSSACKEIKSNVKIAVFGDTDSLSVEDREFIDYDLGIIKDDGEIVEAYSAADVFVAPSLQEAFGKTLIEAMSCQTPVVAFNATGPADIVAHQETGYLAEPFSSASLASGIDWVLENNHNNKLGLASRERVGKHFSKSVIAKKYIDVYNKTMKGSS